MGGGNLSIRLTEAERRALDHDARQHDVGPSTWAKFVIRQHLGMGHVTTTGPVDAPDYEGAIADHERRLSRLEGMAGI